MNQSARRILPHVCTLVLAVFLFAAPPAQATIHYEISLAQQGQHRFSVKMVIPNAEPGTVVAMPAWNALYQVRDFAYRVRDVQATAVADDAQPSPVRFELTKLDKQTWRVGELAGQPSGQPSGAPGKNLEIAYTIEWNDPGPFDSQLNDHDAFINFAEVLMYEPTRRAEDVDVKIADLPEGWKTIAELPAGNSANSYAAASYDKLVDAPLEAGKFEEFEFDNGGAHFRVVMDAKSWNKSHLEDSLRRITGYEMRLMDGPPFKEYTFFFHIGPYPEAGGGGMEHSNGTAIAGGTVESVIQVASHEFFHAWNVKRIRPQTLEPVDYTREQYSRALWFAEGVTSTYSSYALVRTGIWSKDEFYQDLAQQIQFLQSRPARLWQSVEESSLDTWFDKYDAYAAPDRSISYYNKGQILGVLLDIAIREATDNHKSLDDVLRRLNDEYAKQGKFYNDSEGIRSVVEEVAGKPFHDFFDAYISGTKEIPYSDFLFEAGLALNTKTVKRADYGFTPIRAAEGVAVESVDLGSAAEAAGLRSGDVILQINGHPVMESRGGLFGGSAGDTITLHVNREGHETDISYVLGAREIRQYSIQEIAGANDRQRRIRDGILHGTTD
ncbi:MAG TPA: PDZ domain-containing protein [Candidatus Acidoferrales bacterium]|nr:PDZ domain-containing protein [Candidatus Acidoferrales bacterium]